MSTNPESPNVLLLIADDLGQDVVNITGSGATRAIEVHTNDGAVDIDGALPNLSRLLRNGLYFSQAWAQPACSPTRASIYTGLQSWKHGVGSPVGPQLDSAAGFTTLPNLLPSEYMSGLFGKWHLGETAGFRPTDHGWDKHFGTLAGVIPDYYNWDYVDSDTGYTSTNTTDYATLRTGREAADWINGLAADTPWFATVAFHTPHAASPAPPPDRFQDPPGGFDPATPGDPLSDARKFNLMVQNMDGNLGRLLGTVGIPTGSLYYPPIPEDQLSNTIIIFIGDNGSPEQVALEEEKVRVYEYGVRIPMIIADGQAVMNEINGQNVEPRFLHSSRLNATLPFMAHVVDLYKTIVRLVDPDADAFPADTDSEDFSHLVKNPPQRPRLEPPEPPRGIPDGPFDPGTGLPPIQITLPPRFFNFSQYYVGAERRATIRDAFYKLNYHEDSDPLTPEYALFRYDNGEIPNREDDGTATDVFIDARDGVDAEAQEHLNWLLDELIPNYRRDEDLANTFPDPR